MYHASHIIVSILIGMTVLEYGNTAKTTPLIEDLLSMLAGNIGSVLTPNLVQELEKRISNRITTSTISPMTTSNTKAKSQVTKLSMISVDTPIIDKLKTTTVPMTTRRSVDKLKSPEKISEITLDSARAPQTQLENQFPINFRNNYQNYPGASGSLQDVGRQYNGGLFNNRDSFNSEIYRPFNSLFNGDRTGENGNQGIDPRFSGRDSFFNGANRQFNYPDSQLDFDGYQQNFNRFGVNGVNGRLSDGSNRFFDQSFRTDGTDRFSNYPGQSIDDRNNYRQNLRTNYQNSIVNDQGQGFPSFLNSPYSQQSSLSTLPSQRFQNPYDGSFERNQQQQQRGPGFPLFFPTHNNNDGTQSVSISGSALTNSNREKDNGIAPGSLITATRRSEELEKLLKSNGKKLTNDETTLKLFPSRDNVGKLFLPPLADYSDIRASRPDGFKQSLIASNIVTKLSKNNVT